MLVNALLIYFIPGLAWSMFITGIFVAKAIKGYNSFELRLDFITFGCLILIFITSWVGWPWSFYYNLPQMVKQRRL